MATRTATGEQITVLQADDVIYGGLDGQLSAAFKQRATEESNTYWNSSTYGLETPAKAQVKIITKDGTQIIVVNSKLTSAKTTK